jgi:hypothetical protein
MFSASLAFRLSTGIGLEYYLGLYLLSIISFIIVPVALEARMLEVRSG